MTPPILRLYDPNECQLTGYPFAWDHDSFVGDIRYPPIKRWVREWAGDRCERCGHPFVVGVTPGEWSPCDDGCRHPEGPTRSDRDGLIEAKWRVLTTHHLNGVKYDCRWWNLAALCQRCHLTIQRRVVMEQVFPFAHSEWFKPHAAGWYADAYLGLDLTREETMARLDELLALELSA